MLEKLLEVYGSLSWSKILMLVVASIAAVLISTVGIVVYTAYENRQHIYQATKLTGVLVSGDAAIPAPTREATEIVKKFIAKFPEIQLVSIIDANPIANRRTVVGRVYNNKAVESIIEERLEQGEDGSGILIGTDAISNAQILTLLNGEVRCALAEQGMLFKIYPELREHIAVSCRVPLPPAYGKVTGWFSVHLKLYPPAKGEDLFKQEALLMALQYYSVAFK